jgi:UDP-N-acetylmuramoyl-L-alanyl-D-glutamate--2,6-diaminopimelate ligase
VAAHVGATVRLPPGAGAAGRIRGGDYDSQTGQLVTGITLTSQSVQPGDLYAALPGSRTHGANFAGDAAGRGAVAVLTDPSGANAAAGSGLPLLVVPGPRERLGELAAWLFGQPASQLMMLGVTGTNGKTTTTFLLDSALRLSGQLTGMIGTVQTRVGDLVQDSVRTTPEAPDLQALLAEMVASGVRSCSMEVSSHALSLRRVDGIVFDVAGFTNLSQDHLDFHPTMADYFAAKARLFTPRYARQGVVCVDDEWGWRLAAQSLIPVMTLATRPSAGDPGPDPVVGSADWVVTGRIPDDAGGTGFTLNGPGDVQVAARCPLPGGFNVANTALALVMLAAAGANLERAAGWLGQAEPVPGRMQPVRSGGVQESGDVRGVVQGEPLAVVDYAHTPDAITAAGQALNDRGRPLVLVLGAGGDRDRLKRPGMGAAAAAVADVVIVTDDNPRSEDPAQIRAAVLAGAQEAAPPGVAVLEIPGRAAAIAEAVRRAWGQGTVLLTGKGHERGQEIAGVVHPFDDREVLARELAARGRELTQEPAP